MHRRTGQVSTHPPGQQIPQGRTWHRGAGALPHQRHVSGREITPYLRAAGSVKALVTVEHSILTAARNMLANGECDADAGPDHFIRLVPDRAKNRALDQLKQVGHEVIVTQIPV